MSYSNLPHWLQTALGVLNFLIAAALLWFWWPRKRANTRWLWLGALYFVLFWLYMRT
jgi:hypothetical protein